MTKQQVRDLKAQAQHLEPIVFVGKQGITPSLLASLETALESQQLVKVRFSALKDQRHELANELADKTQATLVTVVGHVAVLYRKKAEAAE